MITSDIQELNIDDLNEYQEDRALLLTENEEGYWRKLTLDPNKSVTGTGSPFAYQDNEIISTTNIDESYNNRVSDGTQHVDMYYDFSSGIPTWGLQTSDSGTFRWEPDDRRNVTAAYPKISADSSGNAFIILKQIAQDNLRTIYYDSNINDWTASIILDSQEAPNPDPDIAMSESGIAIAAWIHDNGIERVIQGAYYDPATTTWTSNIDLSIIPTATEDSNPRVAINDSGNGVAVWQSPQNNGAITIQASLFDGATKTWEGLPTTISPAIDESLNPHVGIDNNGNILVVWEELNTANGKSLIFYNSYDAGTSTWGSPLNIPSSLNNAFLPELSVTSNGDAMVVWIEEGGSNYRIEANKYNGLTKTWNTVPYAIDTITSDQYPAKVAMSNLGTAVVIYSKQVSGLSGQYYVNVSHYNTESNNWETSEILDQTTIENSLPDVDINDSGNMVAVWVKNIETNVVIHSSTYQEVIKKWSLPDQISSIRSSFSSNQVIVINNRAASIYQCTSIPGNILVTGAIATINPNIITANDSKVSFAFRKVQEVGEPEVDTDAATKFYVDTAIAAANAVFLQTLQDQGLLKEGTIEALNKKANPAKEEKKEAKKTKKGKK